MTTPDLNKDAAVVEVTATGIAILTQATNMTIADAAGYQGAADTLKRIKTALKNLEDARVRITGPLNASLREINKQAGDKAAPLLQAEGIIKRQMVTWSEAERQRAAAEQARLDAEARKRRENLEAQARRDEQAGRVEQAAAKLARAETVVAPVVSREPPKVAGISMRENWLWECTDKASVPEEYKDLSTTKINGVVRAMKGSTNIPGIRVYKEGGISAGRS